MSGVGKKRIIPFLKAKGIRSVDCVMVSHMDEDHIAGIRELLSQMPDGGVRETPGSYDGTIAVRRLLIPEQEDWEKEFQSLLVLAGVKGVEVHTAAAGDWIKTKGELSFLCLSPKQGQHYADRNSASMVLLATFRDFDLLLTGDATKETEEQIVANREERQELYGREIEVLKAAHHGSSTSTSEQFLSVITPELVIISCGKNNRYGHPHKETLENLQRAGCRVRRTDEEGCITLNISTISRWKIN